MRLTIRPAALLGTLLAAAMPLAAQRPLPPIAVVRGELAIRVEYPRDGATVAIADSTFLFGTVGDGRATLTVDGRAIPVAANGAWLAWVAVPQDSAPVLGLEARLGERVLRQSVSLVRAGWVRRAGAWVARASLQPTGRLWLPADEPLALQVEAAAGASVRLLLPNGVAIPFAPSVRTALPPAGVLALERTEGVPRSSGPGIGYSAELVGEIGRRAGDWLQPDRGEASANPVLEVALDGDTTRLPWPIAVTRLPEAAAVVRLDDVTTPSLSTDRIVIGRNLPGGTYHWFFPNGTIATADARHDALVRLRLGDGATAWVPLAELRPLVGSGLPGRATMGSLTAVPTANGVRLRLPLTHPVPHQLQAAPSGITITLYGVTGDADWTRYPVGSGFLTWLDWRQRAADRIELQLAFDRPVWGWRVMVDGSDLVFEFRQPPAVDPAAPLRGRRIVLDPGHPPLGACGPTALCEPEVTLAVAERAAERLRADGAVVTLTRRDAAPVELWPRVALADSLDAELLLSIHLNALPDGMNPFTNSGTSTFFQHPQAVGLARRVQEALVAEFGLRDLGVARGDLAMVRPTWYPTVLAEGLFLMIPAQEAAMRTTEGRQRYADALVAGVRRFFTDAALSTEPRPDRLPSDPPSSRPEFR
ncbi:MAG TPA: N-acetylmuramoyl-L-alanine amidase [Gemmatimonadales bacterium]|mgnify:CR=1 FL=1|nr:N-acetylmuramoyl-L-alanine amidase [Gemmatimonadales bacterium]